MKLRKFIPAIIIISLITLNVLAFYISKSYFTKTGNDIEVEEMSESEQGEANTYKILSWTYEFFKSFRSSPK
jgi:hypothetical protein